MTRKQQINKYFFGVCVCLFCGAFSLQGCKNKDEQPQISIGTGLPKVATPQKSLSKPIMEQVSSSKLIQTATRDQFDFSSKKDPFKPYIIVKKPIISLYTKSKRTTGYLLPIHSFDVNQFRVIGIISGGKDSQAMVIDPNGKGYVLKVGMTIGKNEGHVVSISAGGIEVIEQFRDDSGKLRKEHIKLSLPRK